MPVIHDLLTATGLVAPEAPPPRILHHYPGRPENGSSVTISDGELSEESDRLHELRADGPLAAVLMSWALELFSAGREVPADLVVRLETAADRGGEGDAIGDDEVALVRTCATWSRPLSLVAPPPPQAWQPSTLPFDTCWPISGVQGLSARRQRRPARSLRDGRGQPCNFGEAQPPGS